MNPALIALVSQVGAPILKKILAGKIGAGNAELVGAAVDRIAQHLGVAPEVVGTMAQTEPDQVKAAIVQAEADAPELIALYAQELEVKRQLFEAEQKDPIWMRAWRPAGMYLIGFLWLWNIVILHVANAIWKVALPPAEFSILLQLSGIYMGLYMGGHTVKDFVSKWAVK